MMLMVYYRISYLDQMSFKKYVVLIAMMTAGVIGGSKLLFIITIIPDIVSNFSLKYAINAIVTAGFVFYGGLIGAILGSFLFSRLYKYDYRVIANIVAPAFPLFHMWGRIGCFFGGCCYGKVASWGFPLASDPSTLHIPVQLFESAFLFCITIVLLVIEHYRGSSFNLMLLYLFVYAVGRFFLEFLRGDELRGIWGGVSTSQIISVLIVVICILMLHKETSYKKQIICDH
jgi:phosphatidylglycerol:prolipoprotein diacylglycerol transferase